MSKKYSFLSVKRKLEVIEELNQPDPPSKRSLGRKFGVDESAIRSIWKKRDFIIKTAESMSADHLFNRKRASAPKFPLLEDRLCGWIYERLQQNLSLSSNLVISQAKSIAVELLIPHEDFKASWGWFKRFKERRGLNGIHFHDEELGQEESREKNETSCMLLEQYTDEKRTSGPKLPALENRLYEWICESNKVNLPLSIRLTILKAKIIAEELSIPPKDFKPSPAWFRQFRERRSLKEIEFCDEGAEVNQDILSCSFTNVVDEASGDFSESAFQEAFCTEIQATCYCPRILPGKARIAILETGVDSTEIQHSKEKEYSVQLNNSSDSTSSQQSQQSTNNTVDFEGFHTIYSRTIELQKQLFSPQAQSTSGELYNEIKSSFERFQNAIQKASVREKNLVSEEAQSQTNIKYL